jgi:imidazolonepropionase-like amidohydrolase
VSKYSVVALCVLTMTLCTYGSNAKAGPTTALVGCAVVASPTAPIALGTTVVFADGKITAVGRRNDLQLPQDARIIDCMGKTVVAGFWNSHVHFSGPQWQHAAGAPADALAQNVREMLTRWGFTAVWDLGSTPDDVLALRRRIAAGEVLGPQIFAAGSVFPKGGHPIYLPAQWQLPEAATADEATGMAHHYLANGLDGVKLFTGAYMGDNPVVNMDSEVAKAAAAIAHSQGKLVFAHPQNMRGVDVVIEAKVDVLAHTVPTEPGYTPEQLARFKAAGTALIPTLSLWTTVTRDKSGQDFLVGSGVAQLKSFAANGGTVLFGTDVGFTTLYDTALELEFMARALSPAEVLASLTTNPAAYFKLPGKGRVEPGYDADIVVIDGNPMEDVRNLSKVIVTYRAGIPIYQRP